MRHFRPIHVLALVAGVAGALVLWWRLGPRPADGPPDLRDRLPPSPPEQPRLEGAPSRNGAPREGPEDPTLRVRGTVRDVSGRPVGPGQVWVEDLVAPPAPARVLARGDVGRDGEISIVAEGAPIGSLRQVRVLVSLEGLDTVRVDADVPADGVVVVAPVVGEGGRIEGRVVDDEGRGVAGVRLRLTRLHTRSWGLPAEFSDPASELAQPTSLLGVHFVRFTSGDDGSFSLRGLEWFSFLALADPGHRPGNVGRFVSESNTWFARVEDQALRDALVESRSGVATLDVVVTPAVELELVVRAADTGQDVQGWQSRIGEDAVPIGSGPSAKGPRRILVPQDTLAAGSRALDLIVSAPGYRSIAVPLESRGDSRLVPVEVMLTPEIPGERRTVTLRVENADGSPYAGRCQLRLYDASRPESPRYAESPTLVGPGEFEVSLPLGRWDTLVLVDDLLKLLSWSGRIEVAPGNAAPVACRLPPSGSLTIVPPTSSGLTTRRSTIVSVTSLALGQSTTIVLQRDVEPVRSTACPVGDLRIRAEVGRGTFFDRIVTVRVGEYTEVRLDG